MSGWQDGSVVVRTVAFLVLRQVLGLVGRGRSAGAKDVEIAVLRHQLAVLHRQIVRPRYTPADRMILATLAKLLPRDRWPIFLVTPSTLLRWHRELIRRRWTYPAEGRSRQALDPEVVSLVLRLARENPRWGYVRVVGACHPASPPSRAGAPPPRPDLDAVPARPSRRHPRVRLPHRRNDRPDQAVCAVYDRVGPPPGPHGRDHRSPDRRVGHAGGPRPADGPGRTRPPVPVPHPTGTRSSAPRSTRCSPQPAST